MWIDSAVAFINNNNDNKNAISKAQKINYTNYSVKHQNSSLMRKCIQFNCSNTAERQAQQVVSEPKHLVPPAVKLAAWAREKSRGIWGLRPRLNVEMKKGTNTGVM